jgi:LAO/AO transport system kinase
MSPESPENRSEGVGGSLNPALRRRKRKFLPAQDYIEGIRSGHRVLLSQAITLVESSRDQHRQLAREIVEGCLPFSGKSIRIGITGPPGVGKSTFIEALGSLLIEAGHRPAVLAIDPSSQVSHGSILGDKTRMERLSEREEAFIRPSPAGDSLGGVAHKTRETILLCEAAGFDVILVETVGVGQSEVAVHSMVDFFLLLILPGSGDELQGIKRGIVEMADLIAVNKADGERLTLAKQARQDYKNALHLFPPKASGWTAKAVTCSAEEHNGIQEVWQTIQDYQHQTRSSGYLLKNRKDQARYWFEERIRQQLGQLFYQHPAVKEAWPTVEKKVVSGDWSSFRGADFLIDQFMKIEK